MGGKRCLICDNEEEDGSSSGIVGGKRWTATGGGDGGNARLLVKQLHCVFILRELLRIPRTSLEKYLEIGGGDDLDSWISVCGECEELVEKARGIFEVIVAASRKFKEVQCQVVEKVRVSSRRRNFGTRVRRKAGCDLEEKDKVEGQKDIAKMVTEESREFVCEHDYGCVRDPFTLGDVEADGWLGQRPVAKEATLEEMEEAECVVVKDEYSSPEGIEEDVLPPVSPEQEEEDRDELPEPYSNDTEISEPLPPAAKNKSARKRLIDEPGAFYREDGKISFRCPVEGCGVVYTDKRLYMGHKAKHAGNSVPCDQCGKEFWSPDYLLRHQRRVHEKRAYKKAVFTEAKREELRSRYQQKCPHCDKVTDKYTLAKHIKVVHENAYRLYCEHCGKGQSSKRDLREHQAETHGICGVPDCRLEFPGGREELRAHQLEVHGREVDVRACGECGKLFVRKHLFRNHVELHEHERRKRGKEEGNCVEAGGEGEEGGCVCHVCGKKIRLRIYLGRHLRAHRPEGRKKRKPNSRSTKHTEDAAVINS